MINLVRSDVKYALISKKFLGVFVLFLFFTCLTFFLSYNNAMVAYSDYTNQLQFLEKNNYNVEESLNEEFNILNQSDKDGMVENPLPYFNMLLADSLISLEPEYAVSQLLEESLIFFPIIASLFGASWVAVDYKNKTQRNRSLRYGKQCSMWSRQLSGVLILLISLIVMSFIVYGIQAVTRFFVMSSMEKTYELTSLGDAGKTGLAKYIKQYIVAIASLLLYYEIGFTFGNLFKGSNVIAIFMCVYTLLIPPLFKYDLSNIFNFLGSKTFEFKGPFKISTLYEINVTIGILGLSAFFASLVICNYIITKKRSAYV